jgi:phosphopantetheinyl transferase
MALQQTLIEEPDFLEAFEARPALTFSAMPGVSVFLFSVERSLAQIGALARLLADNEAARAEEIGHANRRSAYVASRGLLRATLTAFADGVIPPAAWSFSTGAHGKPFVAAPEGAGLRFSLSYTSTLIAIAVSRRFELGVDVETVPSTMSEVPWQVLTQAERRFIRTLPEAEQFAEFLNIWTLKEAYTKYLGVGASLDFRKVEVTTTADRASARSVAETRMPDPMVKQRTIAIGWQQVVLAVAAGKLDVGSYVAPAGEAVTLLHRV